MKIHQASHLDHGLSPAHVSYIVERFAGRDAFFVETFTLPDGLDAVGPLAPREPWDPALSDGDREASRAFWAVHALSAVG